jgi:hypothetical protein
MCINRITNKILQHAIEQLFTLLCLKVVHELFLILQNVRVDLLGNDLRMFGYLQIQNIRQCSDHNKNGV